MKTSKLYDCAMIFLSGAFVFMAMVIVVDIFAILPTLATIAGIIIVGMAVISIITIPIGLLGIFVDEMHKHEPHADRTNIKINHHPIHWKDPFPR